MRCGINKKKSLHSLEHLLDARRRSVSGIGPESQAHQPISFLAQVCRAMLLAVIVVKKSAGHSFHDAQRMLGGLLLLGMLVIKLLRIFHKSRQMVFLAL